MELYGKYARFKGISSCSASSELTESYSCENAFDGNVASCWAVDYNNFLVFGAWIKVNLVGAYQLTKIMVWKWCDAKDISLAFSNGVQMDFTLEDTTSWQTIDLEGIGNNIITSYVNITVNGVYPNTCTVVGFRELKVFGYASGMIYNDNVSKNYLSGI